MSRGSFSDESLWGVHAVDSRSRLDPSTLLEGLTAPQRAAVTQRGGPLLVIAGAGSGKTRVLTRRIAHLLATGDARPYQIMAITFTNKAADEMRRRVVELVGPDADRMWVSTFHSACLRMLRAHADVLGYERGFTIYDAGDAETAVERIMKELNLDVKRLPPRSVSAAISAAKNEMISPDRYFDIYSDDPQRRRIAEIYQLYEKRLRTANAMDFDDLLVNAVAMMQADESVLRSYQERFHFLLVDEFQDTNGVQNELVMMLAAEHRNLCVVGDSDQSIYRFRAADVRNILQFEQRFPDAEVILLEQNFRSTQTILDAANAVIAKNASRHAKNLFTDGAQGEKIRLYRAGDEYDEGRWVASELRRLRSEHGISWNEMAVFYRTNAQSRVLEEEMLRANIPYRVISGMRFYDRKEIKNALAYARLIVNPRDEASARRVINEPKRGVGEGAQAKLGAYAAEHGLSFAEAAHHAAAAGLNGRALAGADKFSFMLDELRALTNDLSPREMIDAIVRESGMGDALRAEDSDEAYSRLENLGELASAAAQYDTLLDFVERMALVADSDQLGSGEGAISMMTLHVAKGLEFPAVVVTGLEETIFPHRRALSDDAELEEERRLFYVGVTRAMRHLVLTHAWSRTMWGQRVDTIPSRFLQEVPVELITDISSTLPTRRSSFSLDDDGFMGRATSFTEGRAFGAGAAPPVRSTGAEKLGLLIGDHVVHDRFGPGVVIRVEGEGSHSRATVNFDEHGTKQLILAMTPLKRA
ncbi:MAG TPA: UvrD-helicase domain-containing protein [Acidimicrobiales bacterium]|nr:UvrD-helicase domain-containing protein [Acidimicrobiales bacterium]